MPHDRFVVWGFWSGEGITYNQVMELSDPTSRDRNVGSTMSVWAYASVAVVLVAGATFNAVFAMGVVFAMHRASEQHQPPDTSIIVRAPALIAGPSIEMALPAGSDLTSANVDTDGGNWWYDNADSGHLHVLIAASKISVRQPEVNNDYFRRVIRFVEQSGGDQITAIGAIQDMTIGSYSGCEAAYDVDPASGKPEHAVALLLRREDDDLLIVLYGDASVSDQVDRAAADMFRSLRPRPTPQQYDVHSAQIDPHSPSHEALKLNDAII